MGTKENCKSIYIALKSLTAEELKKYGVEVSIEFPDDEFS